MEILVPGGTGRIEVPGLGLIDQGVWVPITKLQEKAFAIAVGHTLEEDGSFKIRKPEKAAASKPKTKAPVRGAKKGG